MSRLLIALRKDYSSEVLSLKGEGPVSDGLKAEGIRTLALRPLLRNLGRRYKLLCGWMYHGNLVAYMLTFYPGMPSKAIWNIRQCLHDRSMDSRLTRTLIAVGSRVSRSQRVVSIIYNSEQSRQQHEAIGYSSSKSVLMHNGFDSESFGPDKSLDTLGFFNDKTHYIGMVARYHRVKGHDVFLDAIALFNQYWQGDKAVEFVLIGRLLEPSNVTLSAKITSLDLENVHLMGERHDIPRLLPQLSIVTSASLSEGFSNTIAESMLSEVPCVVTDVGDSAYILGNTGVVIPVEDPKAMADAWLSLLTLKSEEINKQGEQARLRICELFSEEKQCMTFADVLQKYRD